MNYPFPAEQVRSAVAALADDADRENEGDLVVAAKLVTTEQMAFLVRHSTEVVCAPIPAVRTDELQLPPMVADNADRTRQRSP